MEQQKCECISDYVVSSYTPTLKALITPPSSRLSASNPFKMMAVIQSATKGYPPLPATVDELHKIEMRVPSDCLVKLGLSAFPASVDNVYSHLQSASIVHFACHGEQNVENPHESALILDGGRRLTISQIMKQSMSNASLAFLSACQTAMGDEKLPDEAIHLAAALLFAGFHGAVATMW